MRAFIVCLILCGGCGVVKDVIRADKPTARVTGVGIEDFSLDGLVLRFDVRIDNPYSAGLPLVALDYTLASGGQQFLAGAAEAAGTVPARGSRTVPVTAGVRYADLLRVLSSVRPGQVVPYTADFKIGVDAPAVGRLTLPLRKEGTVPVPAVPDVRLAKVAWTRLELTEARAVLHLAVENRNQFAVDLSRLGFEVSFGGVEVARSRIEGSTKFAAGGKQVFAVPISLSPIELGMGVLNVLRGRDASYRLAGTLDLKTPFGALPMPYETAGRVPFVNK